MRALTLLGLAAYSCLVWGHAAADADAQGSDWLVAVLLVSGAWYLAGYWRVRRNAHNSRKSIDRDAGLFAAGWCVIAISLLSPLHALGSRSFTAHMIEHELLMLVAAPLIAWSRPLGVLIWTFPGAARSGLARLGHARAFSCGWRSVSAPISAALLQAAMMWLWHAPALFDRALEAEGWHMLQHLSLLFSALLFWWSMNRLARAGHHAVAAFWLFFTSVHGALLGALMALADSPWYQRYAQLGLAGTGFLSPLEDQQLAGIIMWVPGGTVHAAVALWYLGRWLQVSRRSPGGSGLPAARIET
ncbi:MAG TPA: cytochrome c oxidase assembly protein [Steroidobacteraceae bacterium]|jgi:cytochrome c oxidase assembly factor CtaG